MRAGYGESTADERLAAWTDVIDITMLFVRAEGGYILTGNNDQGERLFERNAGSVGQPAVKAEVAALMADNGYSPEGEWTPGETSPNRWNYTRGPLRRRFRT